MAKRARSLLILSPSDSWFRLVGQLAILRIAFGLDAGIIPLDLLI